MTTQSAHRIPPARVVAAGIAAAIAIAAAITYGSVWGYGFLSWDDGYVIQSNPLIRSLSPSAIAGAFSRFDPELYTPFTTLSYQLDYALGGLHPTVFHTHNLLLHILNALLVCWLAKLLSGRSSVAILTGLLFALHPLNAEAVSWASARKDLLSGFFFLLSIVC